MKFKELEVTQCCAKLKNTKAGGADKIVYEHLKYGGRTLMFHLATLYNIILESGHIPTTWRDSILVPLHKGGNKSKKDPNSNRGISFYPVLSKVLEMVLLSLLDGLSRTDTFPHPQQMAYQSQLSALHTSFNLQDTLRHYHERKEDTHVVLLDTSKAFDKVWHNGLKYLKLLKFEVIQVWNQRFLVDCS